MKVTSMLKPEVARAKNRDIPSAFDKRELCGYSTPRYVLRFCGDWCGQSITYRAAIVARNLFRSLTP